MLHQKPYREQQASVSQAVRAHPKNSRRHHLQLPVFPGVETAETTHRATHQIIVYLHTPLCPSHRGQKSGRLLASSSPSQSHQPIPGRFHLLSLLSFFSPHTLAQPRIFSLHAVLLTSPPTSLGTSSYHLQSLFPFPPRAVLGSKHISSLFFYSISSPPLRIRSKKTYDHLHPNVVRFPK